MKVKFIKLTIVLSICLMFLLVACERENDYRINKEWQIPKVGQRYVHCKNEAMVESNTEYTKYKIILEECWIRRGAWKNRAAFVTIKNNVVVAIWIGNKGW